MNNIMEYKGYVGSVEFSEKDGVFYGKVQGIRSLLLAESDRDHLDQSGLIRTTEGGVRLDAADNNDRVRLRGILIEINRVPVFQMSHFHSLHTGMNGAAAKLLRDAEAVQNLPLSLSGGASVASHSRDNHGQGAALLHIGPRFHGG